MPNPFEFLTVAELAGRLRVDEATVRSWCRTGVVKAIKVGGLWRIPASELDRLITPGDDRGDINDS